MTADQAQPRIACSLETGELSDRRAVWERLLERALRERHRIPGGMQLVFAAHPGVEGELHELTRLEAQCCSFADWKVQRRDEEDVVLEVTAPTQGVAAVRALFEGS